MENENEWKLVELPSTTSLDEWIKIVLDQPTSEERMKVLTPRIQDVSVGWSNRDASKEDDILPAKTP